MEGTATIFLQNSTDLKEMETSNQNQTEAALILSIPLEKQFIVLEVHEHQVTKD